MNIVIIAHYQNDGSPCAIFVHEQVKEFVRCGHNTLVIVPIAFGKKGFNDSNRFLNKKREIDGVKYLYIRYLSLSNLGEKWINSGMARLSVMLFAMRKIKVFSPDVIHSHTLGVDSSIGRLLNKYIKRSALVITTHGSDFDVPYRMGKANRFIDIFKECDCIACVSNKLEIGIHDIYRDARTKTIWNGCNTYCCKPGKKVKGSILFVGSLISQKNADIVIKAFAKLNRIGMATSLKIIGQGNEYKNLMEICANLSIKEKVVFLGQIPNDKVLKCMSTTEYFIMPSVNEGFGIVYIEAMASGCITIGTKREGIDGFIKNNVNGFLVSPDVDDIVDVIVRMESKSHKKSEIINNAIEDAGKLSWECNANKYLSLFKELINESKNKDRV